MFAGVARDWNGEDCPLGVPSGSQLSRLIVSTRENSSHDMGVMPFRTLHFILVSLFSVPFSSLVQSIKYRGRVSEPFPPLSYKSEALRPHLPCRSDIKRQRHEATT